MKNEISDIECYPPGTGSHRGGRNIGHLRQRGGIVHDRRFDNHAGGGDHPGIAHILAAKMQGVRNLKEILRNHRYYPADKVFACTAACALTLIWALIVVIRPDALQNTLIGSSMIAYIHEDAWGWAFLGLSLALLWRLWRQLRPMPIMQVGYAIQAFCWGYIEFHIILRWVMQDMPPKPGLFAFATVGAFTALYAFISSPRERRGTQQVGEKLCDFRRSADRVHP
jgi:hypothetical protein